MNHPKLSHSPILEAMIGISISNNEYWSTYYKDVVDLVKDEYDVVNERVSFRIRGKITPVVETTDPEFDHTNDTQVLKDGYVLSNTNKRKSVLLKPDSIQITKKAPYIEWDDLFVDFKNILSALNKVAPNLLYYKPYLKYKNVFSIQFTTEPIENYLKITHTVPHILSELSISNLNFYANMHEENFNYKIEQILKPSKNKSDIVDVLLNIDVTDIAFETENTDRILSSFEQIRSKKNEIFFDLITEKTKSLFV